MAMLCLDAQLSLCIAALQSKVSDDTALLQQVACLHTYDLSQSYMWKLLQYDAE